MRNLLPVNEHMVERVARVAAGLTLIGLAWQGTIGVWGYLGAIPLLTGLIGSCPVYTILGISTCPYRPKSQTTGN